MNYKVDIVITNKKTLDQKFITEVFTDNITAQIRKEEILNSLKEYEYSHWHKVIPVIKCKCGEEIECYNFTNTCDNCESDYNFAGQLLASREQWGSETGESWVECY